MARSKGEPEEAVKDLSKMAMDYGYVYVARVAMGANDAQTLRALLEAESYDGPSLIIAYSHCIAHGIDMAKLKDDMKDPSVAKELADNHALAQALEGAADQREDYWRNRVQPFWRHVWPKSRDLTNPRISAALIRLVIAARGEPVRTSAPSGRG